MTFHHAMSTTDTVTLRCADGFALTGNLFSGASSNGRAVVIASAMGVPRRFYAPLAQFLADDGFKVLTFDYRGIGDSRDGPVRGSRIRMEDWGRLDIETALQWGASELRAERLFLLGHSAGGQLAGLAPSTAKLSGLVFTAVSSAHPGHWPMPSRLGLLWVMHLHAPLVTLGRDFFPPKLGGLSNIPIPAGVVAQWARWARKPGYLYDPKSGVDVSGYRKINVPTLAWQFDDDTYAPQSAHDAILAAYPNANIERRAIRTRELGRKVGHFGFFREPSREPFWRETAEWLRKI